MSDSRFHPGQRVHRKGNPDRRGTLVQLFRHTNRSPYWHLHFDDMPGKLFWEWEVNLRPVEEPRTDPSPPRSMVSRYADNRRHGADGKFISRRFAAECQKIGDTIRAVRAQHESDEPPQ